MKREDEQVEVGDTTDLFIAVKDARARRKRLADARLSFAAAMESYAVGDPVVGLGLLREALEASGIAARPADLSDPAARDLVMGERLEAQSLCNALVSVLPLFQPKLLLKVAKNEFAKDFKFKKGGSFKGKGAQKPTSIDDGNEMEWRFYVDKDVDCKKPCLISVYHFKGKDKKIVKPAKNGFSKSYLDANTLPKHKTRFPMAARM